MRFKELFPVFARASLALILTSSPLKLVCFNCFPNTGHVIILQRTVSFKLRLVHVHMHVWFMKRQRVKFPWDLYWENKAYKLKRSIPSRRSLPIPDDSRDELQRTCKSLSRRRRTVLDEVKDLHWPTEPDIPLTKSSNVKTKMTRQALTLKGRLQPPRMMHSRKLLSRYSTKQPPSLLTHCRNS